MENALWDKHGQRAGGAGMLAFPWSEERGLCEATSFLEEPPSQDEMCQDSVREKEWRREGREGRQGL